ncbi:MAG TPA: phage holin family protein [Bacteroidia bacterium]|nr:phage holin family protein [Bacteroidia bacterium]
MQEENNPFEKLTDNLKEYVNTHYDIITLKATQKAANVGSHTVALLLIGMIVSLFLLFINIAVGFYLSALLHNSYAGFFIVAGFYLLLTLIFIIGRKKLIIHPLRNFIVKQILNDEHA